MGSKRKFDRRRKFHDARIDEAYKGPSKATVRTTLVLVFLVTLFILSMILLSYPDWAHHRQNGNSNTLPTIHDMKPVVRSSANATEVLEGQSVQFDGRRSYANYNGHITNYTWTAYKGSLDGPVEWVDHRNYFNRTFASSTEYFIVLGVVDNWGLSNSSISQNKYAAISIVVLSKHLKCVIGKDITTHVNQVVSFNGNGSSDDNGTIVNYTWNFGDVGDSGSAENLSYSVRATHTYHLEGIYRVTLGIMDDQGEIQLATMDVTVLGSPQEDERMDRTLRNEK